MIHYIHIFLIILLISSGAAIFITSHNPVRSVLFLIFNFCIATLILFLFEIEFLGFLFLMIYVGAVAVLFLFVVMMINMKVTKIETEVSFNKIFFIFLLLFIYFYWIIKNTYSLSFDTHSFITSNLLLIDNFKEIDAYGQLLFNYYYIAVVIAGLVLLVALIGSVELTIPFKQYDTFNSKFSQLAKQQNVIHFFK